MMKPGRGAYWTWPEAPTPTLARIPLAQTRHSGCWGGEVGTDLQFPLRRPGADAGRSERGGLARRPAPARCPAGEPVAIPEALPSDSSQSGGKRVSHSYPPARTGSKRGKGSCLWSLYCASVSLGSFGSLLLARLPVIRESREAEGVVKDRSVWGFSSVRGDHVTYTLYRAC